MTINLHKNNILNIGVFLMISVFSLSLFYSRTLINTYAQNENLDNNRTVINLSLPDLSENSPIRFSASVTNLSDAVLNPKGFITLSDWTGKLIFENRIDDYQIPPGKTQLYSGLIGDRFLIGRYKVTMALLTQNSNAAENSGYTWVIPWKFLTTLFLSMAILALFIKNRQIKTAKYHKHLEHLLKKEAEEIRKLKEELKKR